MSVYQFKVVLNEIEPPIWRSFQVDSGLTFHQLHKVVQIVMGWEEIHLYEFELGEKSFQVIDPQDAPSGTWGRKQELNAKQEVIAQHLTTEGQQLKYTYDFGDDWEHTLVLEKILLAMETIMPICLNGARNCPPEDSGGLYGYMRLTGQIKLSKEERAELEEWLGGSYDAEKFNPFLVNDLLQHSQRHFKVKKAVRAKREAANRAKPKLTKARLRKELQMLTHDELVQLVTDCFGVSKEVEQFLAMRVGGSAGGEVTSYKERIRAEFFPARGSKPKLGEAKKVVRELEKATQDSYTLVELKLFFVEMGLEYLEKDGALDDRLGKALETMYTAVIEKINQEDDAILYQSFQVRLFAIIQRAKGISDGLSHSLTLVHQELEFTSWKAMI